jgi:hypothetical protein
MRKMRFEKLMCLGAIYIFLYATQTMIDTKHTTIITERRITMKTINDIINQVIEITSERLNDKNVKFEEIGS